MPYFKELSPTHQTLSSYLVSTIEKLNSQEIEYYNYNYKVKHLDEMPDGALSVDHASSQKLKYNLMLNDVRVWQYHRNNGVTKIGIAQDSDEEEDFADVDEKDVNWQIQMMLYKGDKKERLK